MPSTATTIPPMRIRRRPPPPPGFFCGEISLGLGPSGRDSFCGGRSWVGPSVSRRPARSLLSMNGFEDSRFCSGTVPAGCGANGSGGRPVSVLSPGCGIPSASSPSCTPVGVPSSGRSANIGVGIVPSPPPHKSPPAAPGAGASGAAPPNGSIPRSSPPASGAFATTGGAGAAGDGGGGMGMASSSPVP